LSNSSFATAWDLAVAQGTDRLEDAAFERATNGSDTLLMFLLRGRRPERFRENLNAKSELTGTVVFEWSPIGARPETPSMLKAMSESTSTE